MSIELSCPACGAGNSFAEDQAGRLGKCGDCKTPVYLPLREEMPATAVNNKAKAPMRSLDKLLLVAAVLAGIFIGALGYRFLPMSLQPDGGYVQNPTSSNNSGKQNNTNNPTPQTLSFYDGQVSVDGYVGSGQTLTYKFQAPRNGKLKFDLMPSAGSQLYAEMVLYSEFQPGARLRTASSFMDYDVTSFSNYTVTVTANPAAYGNQRSGSFKLKLQMDNPPPSSTPPPNTGTPGMNTAFSNAQQISLYNGIGSAEGTISFGGDKRFYRFQPTSNGTFTVQFNNANLMTLDGKITLYDQNYTQVFSPLAVISGRTYYVEVSSYTTPLGGKYSSGSYKVNFNFNSY